MALNGLVPNILFWLGGKGWQSDSFFIFLEGRFVKVIDHRPEIFKLINFPNPYALMTCFAGHGPFVLDQVSVL